MENVSFPISFGAIAPNDDESVKLFLSIGLDEKTVTTTINNPKVTANLTAVIHEVATKHHSNLLLHRPTLFKYIVSSKIKTLAQLDAAVLFFENHAPEDFKLNEFEEACGVGVEVSAEDIEKAADELLKRIRKQSWSSSTELMWVNCLDMSGKVCHGQILRL
ncbi:glutamine--tRNA ligase, cytoplasmic-like [Brassica napus]|uniref:glutamine--tRNA ligase, cytoplasmic-like n=1 Tax=Brassica napus TaxID=3708 RepID=UPI002078F66C|nr:glutamine--tRNA ligase, cytoplasmic-like [Brassica napus]